MKMRVWPARNLVLSLALGLFVATSTWAVDVGRSLPSFIIIFCDDLGYGDLSCFGHPTIRTPNLDRMAAEGMKLTQFYSAAPVCTPSRAALLTGRLPLRNGMCSNRRRVLFPDSKGGIPEEEITIAEALQAKGYATACIGKWHLGHLPQYLPIRNGFDYYFGIPYSNDMDRVASAPQGRAAFWDPQIEYWNVPLIRNEKIIERPADQRSITLRYTQEAIRFMEQHRDDPFFLYLPHTMVHVPLFASDQFSGKSRRGLYGDTVEEIDWSVGQVLDTLRQLELDENTLVLFCSDNGPWLTFNEQGGSAGLLRDGKGSTWEGGMREPAIAWWPGKIKPGSVRSDVASTMDIFATVHALTGIPLPADRVLDSFDLSPILFDTGTSKRQVLFYYRGYQLMAVRYGPWKAHFLTQAAYGPGSEKPVMQDPPILYNLDVDPSESWDVAKDHLDVLAEIQRIVATHERTVQHVDSQLENENFP